MLNRFEAFDLLCDKIAGREEFAGELVASASDYTSKGYMKLEAWIKKQGYDSVILRGKIRYIFSLKKI